MDIYYIAAQFFGMLGLIVMVLALFQKSRSKMLLFVNFNCIFFIIEYLLLGALAGVGSNLVALCRTILFKKRSENKKFDNIWIYTSVMAAYTITAILTYNGPISLLPIVAEYIYATALWQKDVRKIRYGTAIMVIFWLVYDILVQAWPSAICDMIVFVSTITSIIKFQTNEKQTHQS